MKAEDKKLILRAKNTVDMNADMKFYINEDLSLDTRNHRANIKRLSKTANEQGFSSKVSGDRLIVDGNTYDSNELDILPSRVLRSTAQEKWVHGGLAFRGERSVFSNFYTKPFIVDGYRYISVEQFFQYSKAVYFEKTNLARKITLTSDPKRIQTLGDRIEVPGNEWDEWLAYCQELLYRGMLAKFTQNSSLKKDLLSTGECQLLEATTDHQFGCGIGLISGKWADQSWEGQNLTGRTLMEVRDRLRLQEACNPNESISCDVSTISGSRSSLSEEQEQEYRILARKSKAHFHSSANCYAMMRSIRPILPEKRRPRLPQEHDNITGRSQARNSNMHENNSHESTTEVEDEDLAGSMIEEDAVSVSVTTETDNHKAGSMTEEDAASISVATGTDNYKAV